MQDYI